MARPLRILLVEDDENDILFFSLAVKRTRVPISLRTVIHGQQAIDYLQGKQEYSDRNRFPVPDLIVLDLKLPYVNGFDFLAWRSASPFASVPVIILEGSGGKKDLEKALEMGATLTLTKPAGLEPLKYIVREISEFDLCRA
jgi:CheY-like chemotaxis protein